MSKKRQIGYKKCQKNVKLDTKNVKKIYCIHFVK
jgi:hypothetical protein